VSSKSYSNFGASVVSCLEQRRQTQADLSRKLGRSRSYVHQTLSGHRKPSPEWVDIVARTLKLNEAQRLALHKAAAVDRGFKLDLTKN